MSNQGWENIFNPFLPAHSMTMVRPLTCVLFGHWFLCKLVGLKIKKETCSLHPYLCSSQFTETQNLISALAGAAQGIEHWPANQGVASLIPSQGTCLGCRLGPQWGARERQPRINVSLPLFPSPFPSLKRSK